MKKAIGSVKWSPKIGTLLPQKLGIWPATIRLVTLSQISGLSTNAFCRFSRKSARFRGRWADSASLLRPARGTGMAELSGLKSHVCMVALKSGLLMLTFCHLSFAPNLSERSQCKTFKNLLVVSASRSRESVHGVHAVLRTSMISSLEHNEQKVESSAGRGEQWWTSATWQGVVLSPHFLYMFFLFILFGLFIWVCLKTEDACMAIFSWEHEVYNRWTLVLDNPFVDLLGTYQQQIPEAWWFSFPSIPWLLVVLVSRWCRSTAGGIFARAGFRGKLQIFRGKMMMQSPVWIWDILGAFLRQLHMNPNMALGHAAHLIGVNFQDLLEVPEVPRGEYSWGPTWLKKADPGRKRFWSFWYGHGPRRITLQVADFGGFVPSALVADIWRSR